MAERKFRIYHCPQMNETIRINADSAKGPGQERIAASCEMAEDIRRKCPLRALARCHCEIAWLSVASNGEVWGDFA